MPDLPWLVYAIPFAFIGLIAFAAFYKYLEVRQAAEWPQTTGRVVVSTSEVRTVQNADGNAEQRNFAKIVYEYEVSGQKLRNDRVTIGEDLGNQEVAETIGRYPVGNIVTVYYNPRRPREAVLERELPKGMFGCVIWLVVGGSIAILATFYGFNQLAEYARGLLVNPEHTPIVIGLATMGTIVLVFALLFLRLGAAVHRWPKVTGQIERSEVEEFQGYSESSNRYTTQYRPLISYAYEYNGISYVGSKVSFGAETSSNRPWFVKRVVAKYPPGKRVQVHVDPNTPSEAVLEAKQRHVWILWLTAAVLLGGAIYIARMG